MLVRATYIKNNTCYEVEIDNAK